MKYKEYAIRVTQRYKNVFMHQIVSDKDLDNQIPVMQIPTRFIEMLIRDFITGCGDPNDWFAYVLYTCVPDANELCELYEAEYGEEECDLWIHSLYNKIILINPDLNYKMVEAFMGPVLVRPDDNKVIHVDFKSRRKQ